MRLAAMAPLPLLALLVAATASSGAARTLARPSAPHSVAVNADRQAQASDEASLELVGQFGGNAYAIAAEGGYAYVGVVQRLVVVDVRDPSRPRIVGQTDMLPNLGGLEAEWGSRDEMSFPGVVASVAVVGSTVLVADDSAGLSVVDVKDPAAPRLVGSVPPLRRPGGTLLTSLQVVGHTAYLAAGMLGLVMFDVSTPGAPRRVGHVLFTQDANAVSVSGRHAYVALGPAGVQVVDVGDPNAPREVGLLDTPGRAFDVQVVGDVAYVADSASELTVADVSDPTTPRIVAELDLGLDDEEWELVLALDGSTAYVGGYRDALHAIDVSNPLAPRLVNVLETYSPYSSYAEVHDLALGSIAASVAADGSASPGAAAGRWAYVATGSAGLQVFDLGSPMAPLLVGSLPMLSYGVDMALAGTKAYAVDRLHGMHVIDLARPEAARLEGVWTTRGIATGVAVAGRYAYVTDNVDGDLQVIDLIRPDAPALAGTVATPGDDAGRVAVSGGHAYVAGSADGLQVVDVRDPFRPRHVGGSSAVHAAADVAVQGTTAYVADGTLGFSVFDVADPATPRLLGSHRPDDTRHGETRMLGVAVSGSHAYVIYHTDIMHQGLLVYDVRNPTAPTVVGNLDTPWFASDVAVDGRFVYLVENGHFVRMIDVGRPEAPRQVASFWMRGGINSVAAAGGYVYALGGWTGLLVLKPTGIPRGAHVVYLPLAAGR